MKKMVSVLLVIALLFTLFGCGGADGAVSPMDDFEMSGIVSNDAPMVAVPEERGAESNGDAEQAPAAACYDTSGSFVSVSISDELAQTSAGDGTVLFYVQRQIPKVFASGAPEVSDIINRQIGNYIQLRDNDISGWEADALDFYNAFSTEDDYEFYGWSCYTSVTSYRLDPSYVSLVFYESVYLGGAHPSNTQSALNFDANSGALLTLADVFKADRKEDLIALVLDKINTTYGNNPDFALFEDYEDVVRDHLQTIPSSFAQCWYLTNSGVVFFTNPYEISTYAAGVVTVEMSYDELKGLLREDFIIPERGEAPQGTVSVSTDRLSGDYENFEDLSSPDEISVDLTASGRIKDLKVEEIFWTGSQAIGYGTIYAASCFTGDELLRFSVQEENGFMVSFCGEDEKERCLWFIFEDGDLTEIFPEAMDSSLNRMLIR